MRECEQGPQWDTRQSEQSSGANEGHYGGQGGLRRAVGYVRVSTDMQAAEECLWMRSGVRSRATAQ